MTLFYSQCHSKIYVLQLNYVILLSLVFPWRDIWERWPLASRRGLAPGPRTAGGRSHWHGGGCTPLSCAAANPNHHKPKELFLQAHHHLVVLFFPLNGSHATPIIGSGSGDRSESNCVMQLKREGPFNPSYVVPMPKSRWTQVGMEESAKAYHHHLQSENTFSFKQWEQIFNALCICQK